jgi:hypothetical protein
MVTVMLVCDAGWKLYCLSTTTPPQLEEPEAVEELGGVEELEAVEKLGPVEELKAVGELGAAEELGAVQMGDASWELHCLELGIQPSGQPPSSTRPLASSTLWPLAAGVWPGFHYCGGAKHLPSTITVTPNYSFFDQVERSTEQSSYSLYITPAATARDGGVRGGECPESRHGAVQCTMYCVYCSTVVQCVL